ncbi:hypothetical protein HAX54_012598, partial [Datura stramonium]|nr:hypothetical protein [Datura stramonium]
KYVGVTRRYHAWLLELGAIDMASGMARKLAQSIDDVAQLQCATCLAWHHCIVQAHCLNCSSCTHRTGVEQAWTRRRASMTCGLVRPSAAVAHSTAHSLDTCMLLLYNAFRTPLTLIKLHL